MKNGNYASTWVSHSSISDFLRCPKAYYLRNVYKNPRTRHKISLINPSLALGQSVHEVLESLATIKVEDRLSKPLLERYEEVWEKISGKKGGFNSKEEEKKYKERGRIMLQRVTDHPGPLGNKAIKLKVANPSFPILQFQLSIEKNIILCGKIDWIEYLPKTDSVHIVDFKTGKHEEDPTSLQLGIYCLLVQNLQKRAIKKVSYWYLENENQPREMSIPDCNEAKLKILDIASKIKKSRANGEFDCPTNGCYACRPYLAIINGEAEFIGSVDYQDLYIEKK